MKIKLKGENLKAKRWSVSSVNPFLTFSKHVDKSDRYKLQHIIYLLSYSLAANISLHSRYVITYKTGRVNDSVNPSWDEITVPIRTLCNSNEDRLLKVEVRNWQSYDSFPLIGWCITTLRELTRQGSKFKVSFTPIVSQCTI